MNNTLSIPELLHAVNTADSAAGLIGAVRSLSAVRSPEAVETLITVLGFNNPGAAVAAVDGLVALGDTSVPALLEQLDGYNYGARAWAIRALAMIGNPQALDVLVETARGDFALSVRRAAAKGLGFIDWQKLPENERAIAQNQAIAALKVALNDDEWVVRYASTVGLYGLATALLHQNDSIADIRDCLSATACHDTEVVVKARAKLALSQL
ncbi:HEAT repeat domain-containing protein [Oscillatoria sp. CS-180]|uniref:HEAT repeat domain-containing protein n=1 Tax=Oscillatoria sp. CS-180 TaxID=3021720 RepID=UPI00232B01C9|nr:HEAT repeat domain-containing protein [Oscillatoria sp. CS-180]MDB9529211.1 HEAT repeat domain-containing protein [Oscillatoria sp. CS-180]